MKRYHFIQADVFTPRPFSGNQLAVFTDARGLTGEQMQALTREMNFSESTFVLPPETPGCDVKVRIFTPAIEMPMAGHPTVGTAAILVERGLVRVPADGILTLELGIGPLQVNVTPREGRPPFVWMNHRMPQFYSPRSDRADIAAALGLALGDIRADLPIQVVTTGVPFLFVPLVSLEAIARARSEAAALGQLFANQTSNQPNAHVALFTEQTVDPAARFHARMFSPHLAGIVEDPATGSMAAPFGAYLAQNAVLPAEPLISFVMEQGIELGRPSRIAVEVSREGTTFTGLRIGGDTVIVGEGEIFWD